MASQKYLRAKQPFEASGTVEVAVFAPQQGGRVEACNGFGQMVLNTGTARVGVELTPEQMRELAALLVAQSWEVDNRAA